MRLCAGDPKGGIKREAVEVPRRRSCAWGAVGSRERIALHLCRPPTLAVQLRHLLQRRRVGDSARFAFKHEVDSFQLDRDRAGRVRRQVARLAGFWPADDKEVAVVPERPDPGGMWASIRSYRAEEECDVE